MLLAVIAGVLAEVAFVLALATLLGSTLTAVYVWFLGLPIAGIAAMVLYWIVVRNFCRLVSAA